MASVAVEQGIYEAFPDFLWRKQEAGPSTASLRCKDFAQDDTFFDLQCLGKCPREALIKPGPVPQRLEQFPEWCGAVHFHCHSERSEESAVGGAR